MKKFSWSNLMRRGFPLPFWAAALLFCGCGGALIWIFLTGRENTVGAYALYTASAYLLSAVCLKLPGFLRGTGQWLQDHPKIREVLKNKELRFRLELYFEQFINFVYGIFKILSGVILGSAWIGADGIYNFTQALIQLFQILRRRNPGTLSAQWKSYRFCGGLILVLHLTLTGIVFQMINWNRTEEQGQIMVIATAAFAFYKFISSFIDIARDRKHARPIDSSVRMLELSQAIFAIFSLQTGLLHTFGSGESWEHRLNLAMGCAVCLLVSATGVYMIRRGNREIRKLQEKEHG